MIGTVTAAEYSSGGSTPTRIHSGSSSIDGVPGIRLKITPTSTSTSGAATPSLVENRATRTIVTMAMAPPHAKSIGRFCQVHLEAEAQLHRQEERSTPGRRRGVDVGAPRSRRRTDVPQDAAEHDRDMTTIHAPRPFTAGSITRPAAPPATAPRPAGAAGATAAQAADLAADLGTEWPADLGTDWPAEEKPGSPGASALTAGLSLAAVLAVCGGAAALLGLAFRATLAFFAG